MPHDPGPSTSTSLSETSSDISKNVLFLQVRAFLEASEDVDIDPETVQDLMDGLPADVQTDEDGNLIVEEDIEVEDVGNDDNLEGYGSEDNDESLEEVDMSSIFNVPETGMWLLTYTYSTLFLYD
jgi:hypothetical protein